MDRNPATGPEWPGWGVVLRQCVSGIVRLRLRGMGVRGSMGYSCPTEIDLDHPGLSAAPLRRRSSGMRI